MKNIEIERKFLLPPCSMKRFLKLYNIYYKRVDIEQFYIKSDNSGVERYRKLDEKYIHTIKRGSGLAREEIERIISKQEYIRAKKHASSIIKKSRYIFKLDNYIFELDRFRGKLKGLNILEVEFNDLSSAKNFKLPKLLDTIILSEVTEDSRFTNGYLSKVMKIPSIDDDFEMLLKQIESQSHLKASTSIDIHPFMSGASAIKAILYKLILVIRANQKAILDGDSNIERLHQLRVAMRKIRAIISIMETLFINNWQQDRLDNLSTLMKISNKKRDLDVYTKKLKGYKKLIDKRYSKEIDRVIEYIESMKEQEAKRVFDMLSSDTFNKEIDSIEEFCKDKSFANLSTLSKEPIILLVKPIIKKEVILVGKKGSILDTSSKPKRYHKLRIEFKKLRYLMEFFASIMQKDILEDIIPKLKHIQDILGNFQDLEVEKRFLIELLDKIDNNKTKEAIEALVEQMSRYQDRYKKEFQSNFREFLNLEDSFKKAICRF